MQHPLSISHLPWSLRTSTPLPSALGETKRPTGQQPYRASLTTDLPVRRRFARGGGCLPPGHSHSLGWSSAWWGGGGRRGHLPLQGGRAAGRAAPMRRTGRLWHPQPGHRRSPSETTHPVVTNHPVTAHTETPNPADAAAVCGRGGGATGGGGKPWRSSFGICRPRDHCGQKSGGEPASASGNKGNEGAGGQRRPWSTVCRLPRGWGGCPHVRYMAGVVRIHTVAPVRRGGGGWFSAVVSCARVGAPTLPPRHQCSRSWALAADTGRHVYVQYMVSPHGS